MKTPILCLVVISALIAGCAERSQDKPRVVCWATNETYEVTLSHDGAVACPEGIMTYYTMTRATEEKNGSLIIGCRKVACSESLEEVR